jgi:hypothetical protein
MTVGHTLMQPELIADSVNQNAFGWNFEEMEHYLLVWIFDALI